MNYTVKALALVIGASIQSAAAAVIQVNGDGLTATTNFAISSTDLVNQGQASLDSWTGNGGLGGDVNDGDGSVPGGTDFYGSGAATITFFLDTSFNTYGYDISKVHTLGGWGGATRSQANQNFELLVRSLGSGSFTSVGSHIHAPYPNTNGGAYNTSIELTDDTGYLAKGVDAVRFIYTAAGTNGLTLSEIDVIGVAAVPEPSSTALLGLGGLALALRRRR